MLEIDRAQSKILLVDDQESNLKLLARILSQAGFVNYRAISDSRLTFSCVAEYQPDLLLLDLMMPHLDGFQIIDRLKAALGDETFLPIMVLTADHTAEARRRALTSGANDFLCKPLDANEVVLRATNLLRTRALHAQLQAHNDALERTVVDRSRRIAEQANLIDEASDSIVVVCASDDRIAFWNKGAERLYGWPAAEAVGREAAQVFFPEGPPAHYGEARLAVATQNAWTGEFVQKTRFSEEIVVQSRWSLVSSFADAAGAILVINTNVTAQKQAQAHLLRAQRVESIGVLASGLAHDLNNLLCPISNAAGVLKLPNVTEHQKSASIGIIENCTQRAGKLLRQILSFARGKSYRHQAFAFEAVASSLVDMLRETFPPPVRIETDFAHEDASIDGNPTQIEQLLLNLCVNARDAMPSGGLLTLQTRVRNLRDEERNRAPDAKHGAYLVLAVSDTGCGIPRDSLERIFDPFFTTKELDRGTGLGLFTVQGIVNGHGGFLDVKSEVNVGTTFTVFLPAVAAPANAGSTADLRRPDKARLARTP